MIEEIERLASIDSGSYDVAGVDAVADGFGELFAARGFEVTRTGHELTARRELGGRPDAAPARPRGHGVGGGLAGDPRRRLAARAGRRRHEGLRGHGRARARCRAGARPERLGAVEVLIVPDEELGSPASRAWIEERARAADACLGLEAGWPGGGVVVARGAVGAMYVTARGRTAHVAAHEDEGASAVSVLAPLVAELEAGTGDGAQASVGVFRGGTARQVVPGEAEIHVDLRAPDAAAADALLARIHAAVDAAGRDGRRARGARRLHAPAVRGGAVAPAVGTRAGARDRAGHPADRRSARAAGRTRASRRRWASRPSTASARSATTPARAGSASRSAASWTAGRCWRGWCSTCSAGEGLVDGGGCRAAASCEVGPGEAQDQPAGELQRVGLAAVGLEGDLVGVRQPGVGLDDDAVLRPREVVALGADAVLGVRGVAAGGACRSSGSGPPSSTASPTPR